MPVVLSKLEAITLADCMNIFQSFVQNGGPLSLTKFHEKFPTANENQIKETVRKLCETVENKLADASGLRTLQVLSENEENGESNGDNVQIDVDAEDGAEVNAETGGEERVALPNPVETTPNRSDETPTVLNQPQNPEICESPVKRLRNSSQQTGLPGPSTSNEGYAAMTGSTSPYSQQGSYLVKYFNFQSPPSRFLYPQIPDFPQMLPPHLWGFSQTSSMQSTRQPAQVPNQPSRQPARVSMQPYSCCPRCNLETLGENQRNYLGTEAFGSHLNRNEPERMERRRPRLVDASKLIDAINKVESSECESLATEWTTKLQMMDFEQRKGIIQIIKILIEDRLRKRFPKRKMKAPYSFL